MLKTLTRYLSRYPRRDSNAGNASAEARQTSAQTPANGRRRPVLGEGLRQALEQDND